MFIKKQFLIIVFLGLCLTAIGCESTKEKIHETDRWMKDNMW